MSFCVRDVLNYTRELLGAFSSHMAVTAKAIGLKSLQHHIVNALLEQFLLRYVLIAHDPLSQKSTIIIVATEYLMTLQFELLVP